MEILFIASEVMPWSKTGGLADVAGALPQALAARGHRVTVVSPLYESPEAEASSASSASPLGHPAPRPESLGLTVPIELGDTRLSLELFEVSQGRVQWLFLGNRSLYAREGIYGEGGRDYEDNALRFAALSLGAREAMRALGRAPEILHANDWQTGPAVLNEALADPGSRPSGLRPSAGGAALLRDGRARARTVFTIHNLAFQGLFPPETLERLGWPRSLWNLHQLEFHGRLSFLKAGLVFADALTTVSPTYARELQTPEHGCGLDGLLLARGGQLHGILNGIDTTEWDPRRDPHLPDHYSAENLRGKARCKAALQAELGLPVDPTRPLFTSVSRLTAQKGFDLLLQTLDARLFARAQVAILGSGDAELQRSLLERQRAHPRALSVRVGFDEALAHRLTAAGDLFLMPSRFEPCGLNQLYSLRYGTLPIVRATGGLADTVEDASEDLATGTGFVFREETTQALRAAMDRALAAVARPDALVALRRRGMAKDFSWGASSAQYERLYRSLLAS